MKNVRFDDYNDIYRICTGKSDYNINMPKIPWNVLENMLLANTTHEEEIYNAMVEPVEDTKEYGIRVLSSYRTDNCYDIIIRFRSSRLIEVTELGKFFIEILSNKLMMYFVKYQIRNISRITFINDAIKNDPTEDYPAFYTIYVDGIPSMRFSHMFYSTVNSTQNCVEINQIFQMMANRFSLIEAIARSTSVCIYVYLKNLKSFDEVSKTVNDVFNNLFNDGGMDDVDPNENS